jgi:hypothetical protein
MNVSAIDDHFTYSEGPIYLFPIFYESFHVHNFFCFIFYCISFLYWIKAFYTEGLEMSSIIF